MISEFEDENQSGNVLKAAIETLLTHDRCVKEILFDDGFRRRRYLFDGYDYTFDVISTLSGGEKILAMIALNFWDESQSVSLYEIIQNLDSRNFHCLIEAMDILRGTTYSRGYQPISSLSHFYAYKAP